MNRFLIATASTLALAAGAAHAQDGVAEEAGATTLEAISVTANRTPTEKSKTGSKVEQVTKEEIEAKSFTSVTDYLTRLPGISTTTSGGPGTLSSIAIRGASGKYIKTLYNGIDISDPANTQVQTHYEHLLTGGITGIEVLKGSQSTLYGSSAIAGLVDITTLGEVEDGISHTVHVEGGSFGTVRGRYGFAAARGDSKITANASGFRTDGISAAAGQPERDGYDNVTLDLAAEHRINEAFSVFGSLLYIDAKSEYDDYMADNFVNHGLTEAIGGRFGFNADLMDGRLKNTFSVQLFQIDRKNVEDGWLASTSTYEGRRQKLEYQGSFEATSRVLLQYGADYERQAVDTTMLDWLSIDFPPPYVQLKKSVNMTGVWAQANFEPLDNLFLTAGLRHDEHSDFGGHTTYRGTAAYLFDETGTRLHSSIGTGFRAPSLAELYEAGTGNPDLKPETSVSFDIGIEQKFLDGRATAGITYFLLDVEDLIVSRWPAPYEQISGTTRSQGVEASFSWAATSWLDLAGSYTYTDSKTASGARNTHIPRHSVVLSASARPAEKWTIDADLKFVGDTVDSTGSLKDYVLLNAKVAYQVNENAEVYLRGENLLDQKYQTVRHYGTPGIAAYAGFKAKF